LGEGCLVSFGIWIRTADPHLIFDAESQKRINPSRNVIVGDKASLVLAGETSLAASGLDAASVEAASFTVDSSFALAAGDDLDGACTVANPAGENEQGALFAEQASSEQASLFEDAYRTREVAYSAAKAAVIGLTKALAKEVGPSGIRVNCVAPGVIDTDMNAALTAEDIARLQDETPLCRIGTAQETAEAIVWLAEDRSSFVTGQVLAPNGGIVI